MQLIPALSKKTTDATEAAARHIFVVVLASLLTGAAGSLNVPSLVATFSREIQSHEPDRVQSATRCQKFLFWHTSESSL